MKTASKYKYPYKNKLNIDMVVLGETNDTMMYHV